MIYLATPYSDPDHNVRETRFRIACQLAGELLSRGVMVFSPIAHSHPIARERTLPTEFEFWSEYCRQMLSACSGLIVAELDGWRKSVGMKAEIEMARSLNIPVLHLEDFTVYGITRFVHDTLPSFGMNCIESRDKLLT